MTDIDATFDRFVGSLRSRLASGAATYGETSFQRPARELVDEIMEELEDVCGWSLILWTRLEGLRENVDAVTAQGGDHEQS